jgi:hypothetical protein
MKRKQSKGKKRKRMGYEGKRIQNVIPQFWAHLMSGAGGKLVNFGELLIPGFFSLHQSTPECCWRVFCTNFSLFSLPFFLDWFPLLFLPLFHVIPLFWIGTPVKSIIYTLG